MSSIAKFENTIGGWLKPLPHLPEAGRKWLAENIWWIALVGLILSVIGMVMLIGTIIVAFPFIFGTATIISYYSATAYTGFWMVSSVVSLIFMIATVVITAMAISPLKKRIKKGWDLMFITLIIGGLSAVLSAIINFNVLNFVPSIIFAALGLAIGSYFLYEIRSFFDTTVVAKKTK